MIEHLRGREGALAPLGWTGREAGWIALVCFSSGVFTRTQFCCYFNPTLSRLSCTALFSHVSPDKTGGWSCLAALGAPDLCRYGNRALLSFQ